MVEQGSGVEDGCDILRGEGREGGKGSKGGRDWCSRRGELRGIGI